MKRRLVKTASNNLRKIRLESRAMDRDNYRLNNAMHLGFLYTTEHAIRDDRRLSTSICVTKTVCIGRSNSREAECSWDSDGILGLEKTRDFCYFPATIADNTRLCSF
jgi:hypothetical protein